MRHSSALVAFAVSLSVVAYGPTARASILGSGELQIDFTNEQDASKKSVWSPADKLSVTGTGLGWDGATNASYDGWIQTRPLAVGLSWRPARAVSVSVEIQPAMSEITLPNGQRYTPDAGDVYIRYSPDRKHWSSWQALERGQRRDDRRQLPAARYYHGTFRVPYRNQQAYNGLVSAYSTFDVPWKSDEEAAVRWILEREPDFFAKQVPFMGYVEFLVEQGFPARQRVQSLKAHVGFGLGGLHVPARDAAAQKDRDVPWRFAVDDEPPAAPSDAPRDASPKQ
jgi:hypothetical protein